MRLTQRQKGIMALRDLIREYDTVLVGKPGVIEAYENFLTKEGIALKPATARQLAILSELQRAWQILYPTGNTVAGTAGKTITSDVTLMSKEKGE